MTSFSPQVPGRRLPELLSGTNARARAPAFKGRGRCANAGQPGQTVALLSKQTIKDFSSLGGPFFFSLSVTLQNKRVQLAY